MPRLKNRTGIWSPSGAHFLNVKNFSPLPLGKIYCGQEKCRSWLCVLIKTWFLFLLTPGRMWIRHNWLPIDWEQFGPMNTGQEKEGGVLTFISSSTTNRQSWPWIKLCNSWLAVPAPFNSPHHWWMNTRCFTLSSKYTKTELKEDGLICSGIIRAPSTEVVVSLWSQGCCDITVCLDPQVFIFVFWVPF